MQAPEFEIFKQVKELHTTEMPLNQNFKPIHFIEINNYSDYTRGDRLTICPSVFLREINKTKFKKKLSLKYVGHYPRGNHGTSHSVL